MKVRTVTLGCKVNQCESAAIVTALRAMNVDASEGLEPADVYVLNTCSVTAEADRKSRQYIAKMQKENPNCHIIVVGCSSQNNAEKFKKNNVYAVGGTGNKVDFVCEHIDKLLNVNEYSILSDRILYHDYDKTTASCLNNCANKNIYEVTNDKTRCFVKIQDGCNRFCTYCIIPYLRGRSKSIEIEKIKTLCENCASDEIVLTGIDISYYGRDIGCSLTDLIKELKPITARKRLGSLECEIVSDELLNAMIQSNFCPHFHLSLQSGSDEVLKSMNRHYSTAFFKEKVDMIRKYFPLAGITTDIIVGFPTETEELFKESVDFIKECAFSDIHVFPYSKRAGTLASKKYNVLPKCIVDERVKKMLEIKSSSRNNFFKANIGKISAVYAETRSDNYSVGYTPNYIKVYSDCPCGEVRNVKLKELFADGIIGEVE